MHSRTSPQIKLYAQSVPLAGRLPEITTRSIPKGGQLGGEAQAKRTSCRERERERPKDDTNLPPLQVLLPLLFVLLLLLPLQLLQLPPPLLAPISSFVSLSVPCAQQAAEWPAGREPSAIISAAELCLHCARRPKLVAHWPGGRVRSIGAARRVKTSGSQSARRTDRRTCDRPARLLGDVVCAKPDGRVRALSRSQLDSARLSWKPKSLFEPTARLAEAKSGRRKVQSVSADEN